MAKTSERLARFVDHEPQTNEVRRSACLAPGFLALAEAKPLPMRIFELGASAGLNQLWDRYAYDLGDAGAWGPPDSPVRIPTDWRGPPPPLDARIEVTERAACDRKPVDLADPAARQRLRAYVWADQRDRLDRLDAAVAAALGRRHDGGGGRRRGLDPPHGSNLDREPSPSCSTRCSGNTCRRRARRRSRP